MIFNKKTEKKEKMISIEVNRKYQKILTLMCFDNKKDFSDAINSILEVNENENNETVKITINELTYLKLKNTMYEKNLKTFDELFKYLLC